MNLRTFLLLSVFIYLGGSTLVSATTFDEDEYTLLDLQYQRHSLMDGMEAYVHNGSVYILLSDIVYALELDITVGNNNAHGFLTPKRNAFKLEGEHDQWSVYNKRTSNSINGDHIVILDNMIYVKETLIEQWFGMKFKLNYSELQLHFTTSQSIPAVERIKRNNRTIGSQHGNSIAQNPLHREPYDLVSLPSIDLRVSSRRSDSDNADAKSYTDYTLISHGDLGYMNTEIFLSGSQEDDVKSAAIRMDRIDASKKPDNPLGLSQISIGDLSHPSLPFAPSSTGRGIIIGNDITTQQTTQDVTTIEGDFYPEWEVELYLGGSLIGYQIIPNDGHYKFDDVILFLGNNRFELKFYGPNGKIESKIKNIVIGTNPGDIRKLKYTLSISEPNQRTINIDSQNELQESKSLHSTLTTRYAINQLLSVKAGFQNVKTEESEINYASVGMQANLFGTTFAANASSKDNQLFASTYSLNGNLLGTRYSLGTTVFENGVDDNEDLDNFTEKSYRFTLSSRILRHNLTFRAVRNERLFGFSEKYKLGISGSIKGISWSNSHDYSITDDGFDNTEETLFGGLFLSKTIRSTSVRLRLRLGYKLAPESELQTAGFNVAFRPTANSSLSLDIFHNKNTESTTYEVSNQWDFKYLQITPRLRYDTNGNSLATLQFSTSLGKRNGLFGNYYNLDSRNSSRKGALRARLFEDINLNGAYDHGETLLEGGQINATQLRKQGISNNAGIAWIEKPNSWVVSDIEYESDTLNSGSLLYTGKPFSVSLRPGKVTSVDMPFTRTGDIDGTVFRQTSGNIKRPVQGATVIVLNDKKVITKKGRTDSDGYFTFEGLLPDIYTIVIKNEKIVSRNKEYVTITGKGEFIDSYNVVIAHQKDGIPSELIDINKMIRKNPSNAIKPAIKKTSIKSKTLKSEINLEKKVVKNIVKSIATTSKNKTQSFPIPEPAPITTSILTFKKQVTKKHIAPDTNKNNIKRKNLNTLSIQTGDIDGTIYRQNRGNKKNPAEGTTVYVINSNRDNVAKNTADAEGFFSIEGLPSGTYTLEIENESIISRNKNVITITDKGEYIGNYDIVISSDNDENLIASQKVNTLIKNKPTSATVSTKEILSTMNVNKYAIQIASLSEKTNIDLYIKEIESLGKRVYTQPINTPNGTFTRIYVGPFSNLNDAEIEKIFINRKIEKSAFIVDFENTP